ncbi:MAG TPA: coproporphyrinogen III oxidase, partial [Flavisolibacter sp.]|nr:coproporphyrinogen III oxidase [Flavisolibacter sp.]
MTANNKEHIDLSLPFGGTGEKESWIDYIYGLQDRICTALEETDGKAKFIEDAWLRPEGGGGKTRVIAGGNVFEKGGVNTSVVWG